MDSSIPHMGNLSNGDFPRLFDALEQWFYSKGNLRLYNLP
jgi:hypothetical protein